nr:MAG TPA: hypothetical protein [Caudoviricetes sp.]
MLKAYFSRLLVDLFLRVRYNNLVNFFQRFYLTPQLLKQLT